MPGKHKGTQPLMIEDQGDRTLIVRFGNKIDPDIGLRCLAVAATLRQAALPGVVDIVPSYTAVAIQYKVRRVSILRMAVPPRHVGCASFVRGVTDEGGGM